MQIEILAPAGNEQSFNAAVNAGANAIYLGLKEFSARGSAENFSLENLDFYLKKAHFFGVKIYIAVNTLIKNGELKDFFETVLKAYELGADAFIVQDMFLGKFLKEKIPGICLHLSTQAGVCNVLGAELAKRYGFSRVILARETSKEEIKKIAAIIETEGFVHGALCSSFSGHCYLSSFVGGLSGNRGYCKQPCRKYYTYSGNGFKSFSGYNLSLSDLCLASEVKSLEEACVSSFKIEGRMRSPEYVYEAVSVYSKAILGNFDEKEFSLLKRGFNRGHFTKGYYLPKSRDIISSKIQGNIGDFVGKAFSVVDGVAKVKTNEEFVKGDGFKCLYNGVEIDGGSFISQSGNVLSIGLKKAKVGSDVYITKDQKLADYVSGLKRIEKVKLVLYFKAGERAKADISFKNISFTVFSDEIFDKSESKPVSESEIKACFDKVGDYPISPETEISSIENVFVPKSLLNAFRRKCYAEIFGYAHNELLTERGLVSLSFVKDFTSSNSFIPNVICRKNIVIISDSCCVAFDDEKVVVKPYDYSDANKIFSFAESLKGEKYLYLPPFANTRDLEIFSNLAKSFDGVYIEGYYGLEFAEKLGIKFIAGTGLNVFNDVDVSYLKSNPLCAGYCYSKELSVAEISAFANKDGYRLSLGDVQVMDLIYCPFSFTCEKCNRGNMYTLTDEQGRQFKVRRYKISSCRFEVYNPFKLVSSPCSGGELYDFTASADEEIQSVLRAETLSERKAVYGEGRYTSGNLPKGVK
ncbi:MAG: U32 family peptidase [Christensenellaceae bacterium]|nr:U32 family peptidase [Christensenellaceae bacterium]